jgi:hypothetical protein
LAEVIQAGEPGKYIADFDAMPLANAGYISINEAFRQPPNLIAAYPTDAGRIALADSRATPATNAPPAIPPAAPKQENTNLDTVTQAGASADTSSNSDFVLEDVGAYTLPPSKRGGGIGGGRTSKYPFDQLAVNQTFFIKASAAHPKPWISLASTVGTATQRYAKGTGAFELKDVRVARKDPTTGKVALDADGKRIYDVVKQNVEKKDFERKFVIREGTDKDGNVGGRVFRVK